MFHVPSLNTSGGFLEEVTGGPSHSGLNRTLTLLEAPAKSLSEQVTVLIHRFAIPVIVGLGIIGNTLSFLVFTRSHLRYQSSSVYLAFLNIADSGYLIMLFISWFGWVNIHIMHWNGWCQLVVYLTYVFSFLSVWTVVAFTVERFIVVFRPLLRQHLCTRKRAKIVVASLTVTSLLGYSVMTWTTGVHPEVKICTPYPKYVQLIKVVNYIDTAITLVVPSAALIVLNCCTGYKIYSFLSREGNLRRSQGRTVVYQTSAPTCPLCETQRENTVHYTARGPQVAVLRPIKCNHAVHKAAVTTKACSHSTSSSNRHSSRSDPLQQQADKQQQQQKQKEQQPLNSAHRSANKVTFRSSRAMVTSALPKHSRREYQMRTTRTLVMVSTAFVILNLPSHVFRLHNLVTKFKNDRLEMPAEIEVWSHLSLLIYYLNFAVNFLLYVAWSKYFRDALRRMCLRAKHRLQNGLRKLDGLPVLCSPRRLSVDKAADMEPRPSTLHDAKGLQAPGGGDED